MLMAPKHRRTLRNLAVTLALVWLGCLAYALLQQLSGLLTLDNFVPTPQRSIIIITFYYWLPWVVLAPIVAVCSARFPIRPNDWVRPLVAHVALMLSLALLHGLVIGYIYHYSALRAPSMAEFEPWQHAGHFLFGDDMLLFDAVIYAVFAATLNIRNFQQIVRRQEIDASRLNQRLAELRLQTLRMQVNPHFLFNALNAISVLIKKGDNARADENIKLLSRFFRQTLDTSDRHWVSLQEELDIVRQYVAIAKLRFGDRLQVRECYEPSARHVAVPAMLLQPLVENAVTHGFGEKLGGCELSMSCRVNGERLRIEIVDNGAGGQFYADPGFEEGTGLANVRGRLEQMYGRTHEFEIASTPGSGTRVRIDLPLRPADVSMAT
jgi:two-component system LytT family sensor kinase